MDPKKVGLEDVNWIRLAQDRDHCVAHANTVINFQGYIKFW
jgi:hypothetical protein